MCWIKLHRDILKWEWHDDPHMVSLWMHLLCLASHEETRWHGRVIGRGQLVTSHAKLAEMVGVTVRNIRTCIQRLKETGEIVAESTNKYSIVTICNYDKYQLREDAERQATDKQPTSNRQATDKPNSTRIKEDKIKEKDTLKGIKKERAQEIVPFRSERFWKTWDDLLTMPKWRNKTTRALEMALRKLGDYDEDVAIRAIETAIAGDYQGVFPDSVKVNSVNGSKGTLSEIERLIQYERGQKQYAPVDEQ